MNQSGRRLRISTALIVVLAALVVVVAASRALNAQQRALPGTVQVVTVHGRSLEGNLEGDSPDRQVSVFLPPSYQADGTRRFPVVYLLHGFTDTDDKWFRDPGHFVNVPTVANRAFAAGSREVIIVTPNAYTKFGGSFYSTSVLTGDWERFVTRDLVEYIDGHFRTIPAVLSRGLAGHSMGGYGALRIGIKHPDVFASVYALSPCCMVTSATSGPELAAVERVRTQEQFERAPFLAKAEIALAAAWSPRLNKPPFSIDLLSENGQVRPEIVAKWDANSPLAMIDQYVGNLKELSALGFDAGDKDLGNIADTIRTLDATLTNYQLQHRFEIYPGTHTSGIAERVEKVVLPFFSGSLQFDAPVTASVGVR